MTANTIKLIDLKYIDMYHFQMWEGKFQDLEQNTPTFIYANVSNFETESFEDSDVRVYAHSYEDLYSPEDYELNVSKEIEKKLKEIILAEIKEREEYAHEAIEICPECGYENSIENWKPNSDYISTCKYCGSEMFLCDECTHADDNPEHKCNWHKEVINGEEYSCCIRGRYKIARDYYYITIYADNTGWYTEDELNWSNMVDIKVPRELMLQWYEENPELEANAIKELKLTGSCGFYRWLMEVSECNMTDGLFAWLVDHGYTPNKSDAIR